VGEIQDELDQECRIEKRERLGGRARVTLASWALAWRSTRTSATSQWEPPSGAAAAPARVGDRVRLGGDVAK